LVFLIELFVPVLETQHMESYGDFILSISSTATSTNRFDFDLSKTERIKIIDGYDALVQSRIDAGWFPYLVTFMFAHLRGNPASKLHQMQKEIERVYSIFLTHVVRYPNPNRDKPILIGMPDLPVSKWKKKSSVSDIIVNDGLHFHTILLAPPKSRLRVSVEDHFYKYSFKYLGDRRTIDRIDIVPITTEATFRVIDYIFKQLKRGFSYNEHVLILPKAFSEMSKPDLVSI
jgi:hypothetical protein